MLGHTGSRLDLPLRIVHCVLCPLYLRKQTSFGTVAPSASCQKRTHALRQKRSLFDHLVGSCARLMSVSDNCKLQMMGSAAQHRKAITQKPAGPRRANSQPDTMINNAVVPPIPTVP